MKIHNQAPAEILQHISNAPGIYQFYDEAGHLLYVGKAKNLRARLRSYFAKNLSPKTAVMMQQAHALTTTVLPNENDALIMEADLIKQHRPKYNILMRDDKSYPYLYLSTDHDYPRLDFYRGQKNKPGRYFGPYPNIGSLRQTLALLQKVFKLRQCSDHYFKLRTRPCLQYQINRCSAPCVGYISEDEYRQEVKFAELFLDGKDDEVIQRLQQKMDEAAAKQQYEQAAEYRDQIIQLRKLQADYLQLDHHVNMDVLAIAQQGTIVMICILFVRHGHLHGHRDFRLKVNEEDDEQIVLESFIPQFYLSSQLADLPDRLILATSLSQKKWLQSALRQYYNKPRFSIIDSAHKKYKKWLTMAARNVQEALNRQAEKQSLAEQKLQAVQSLLNLKDEVELVECFDVSHIQGDKTVASCTAFTKAGLTKSLYRRYNIKQQTAGDDYAALSEALIRHYQKKLADEQPLPNLIVIDGGKGQLHAAEKALAEMQLQSIPLVSIAKGAKRTWGKETIFIAPHDRMLEVDVKNLGFMLLLQVRDEAHRFAIKAHRQRRSRSLQSSELEKIEGIGPKRRESLLRHFGGRQALLTASEDDIAKVPHISPKLAKQIYQALHAK